MFFITQKFSTTDNEVYTKKLVVDRDDAKCQATQAKFTLPFL